MASRLVAARSYAGLAALRNATTSIRAANVAGARFMSSTTEPANKPDDAPRKEALSIIDSLPGNSLISKAGILSGGVAAASLAISKEIYVMNEEFVVLCSFIGLCIVVSKAAKEPFRNLIASHREAIRTAFVQARAGHKETVQSRLDEMSELKDLAAINKDLFEMAQDLTRMEAQAFELQQKIAFAGEARSTLDSWVRYEASIREREQKQLADSIIAKVTAQLQDPKVQSDILNQCIADAQKLIKTA
ncbi:hypothetical protein GQ42DRAFT_160402 [Ramicandelaber brevisporus]|nr:hypothetical protein GQ42DRAFT_160402 [Ramicandelaber brevisporus]